MSRLLLTCVGVVLVALPVRAADYLNGDWYILAGTDTVATSDPGDEVAVALAKEKGLKALAFTAEGNWSFVFGGNGIIYSGGMPTALVARVPELWKVTSNFTGLAFRPQGGWVLLHDSNGFAQEGIPAALRTQLEQSQKAGHAVQSVAFAPDGGWVLLRERDFVEEGAPKALQERLADHYKKRIAVRCVSFTSQGDWFLIDAAGNAFTSSPNHAAYKRLVELKAKGQAPRWIAFAPGEFTHGYVLEHHPVERIRAVLSQHFSRPQGGVNLWIALPPQAPELPRQRDVKRTLAPESVLVPDAGPLTEHVRLSRIVDKPAGFTAVATYEITLYTNRLVPRAAGQPAGTAQLTPELHAAFTHVTPDMKTKVFREFLDKSNLHKTAQEDHLSFARRAFLHVAKHFTYLYPNPDKVDVVEVGKGDCGGLSWVFVRTLRTSGIPARLILGRWAASEVPAKGKEERNGQFHVKAEFFIEGLGWIGADLSGSVSVAGNPFVCFGAEPGDFVVLDLDVDRLIKLRANDKKPAELGGSQGFFWWWYTGVGGAGPRLEEHWTVEVLDRHPAATAVHPSWKRPPPSGPHTPRRSDTHTPSGLIEE